ncbi:pentapeptide repeat-containing protein [Gloeocapsopsis sp. IPPAS B-1203]|uniref:pentapeptide repeat-containing protein n=1 Tax=Gloeocapsopsis sp. IPPAS B-1203 TaxID=2049454 RepID=UPI000C17F537|nr:pentapeptide repeat-containing protein [Gloeocapsopsis sp. IPPAS B-1203]PIG94946.1 low-complexity protein [Gloeocapsopsis sp. IPPAS B-1203]
MSEAAKSQQTVNDVTTLLQKYAAGKRDFNNANLSDAQLFQQNLKGVDFSYTDLSQANLSNANLRGADLSYTDLSQADLSQADLRGSLLLAANLRQAKLQHAKLEGADYDRNTHFPENFDPAQAGMKQR